MEPILTIRDLDFHYGEIHALDHVNFDVYPGEIVAMIGSNGAGKTTLLRTISGLLGKNTGGTIYFMGKRIDSMPSHKIAGMRLLERENQNAGTLSGGEQQMVAVSRALMGNPQLLMMDEPSMGLAPLVIQDIFRTIKKIHDDGVTVLLVEQNANAALKIADRAYVLEIGKLVKQGPAEELANDDSIRRTYLGVS